jgi:hypothetical protein
MRITLITPSEHKELKDIYSNVPKLTFQNNGYEYIDKSKFTESDKTAFDRVTEILKKSVHGFSCFNNFRLTKNNEIELRLHYRYNESFTGVGYILLDELLNGFNN